IQIFGFDFHVIAVAAFLSVARRRRIVARRDLNQREDRRFVFSICPVAILRLPYRDLIFIFPDL
ncbi:hypothetical protein U1Q18_043153, partial [Sarracenia purpurea var. burkii]